MSDLKITDVLNFLEQFAPLSLAESWDNVGLLLGDRKREVTKILTCLTLTPDVATEAIAAEVNLIVTHHPILFRPRQKLTTDTTEGRLILDLIAAGIAVYSPHTAFDSAQAGINQQWCERLKLQNCAPLRPLSTNSPENDLGSGRSGQFVQPLSLRELLQQLKQEFGLTGIQYVGSPEQQISKLGVACGSAGEFLHDAQAAGCQAFLTGETRFHTALEAREAGIALILIGHYASERFACERLAEILQQQFPNLTVFASQQETDPLQWIS